MLTLPPWGSREGAPSHLSPLTSNLSTINFIKACPYDSFFVF